jgi:hypothetical protein
MGTHVQILNGFLHKNPNYLGGESINSGSMAINGNVPLAIFININ